MATAQFFHPKFTQSSLTVLDVALTVLDVARADLQACAAHRVAGMCDAARPRSRVRALGPLASVERIGGYGIFPWRD
jgi:hypothetical protein